MNNKLYAIQGKLQRLEQVSIERKPSFNGNIKFFLLKETDRIELAKNAYAVKLAQQNFQAERYNYIGLHIKRHLQS